MTLLAPRQHALGATLDATIASELGVLPFSLVTNLAGSSVASSEAFTAGAIKLTNTLVGESVPSDEAFTAGLRVFPKGANGTKPTTSDTRTTVTGPEDLSGKKFPNPVLLTGSGLVGTRVVFSKKPTFQDCDASLTDVWFDQSGAIGLVDIIGATTTTNVTVRRFTANQFLGDALNVDGTHIGTVNLYNGRVRPLPADAGSGRVFAGSSVPSSEAFTAGAIKGKNTLVGVSVPSDEAFDQGEMDIAGALGAVVPFTVADIGDQIYGTWAPGSPSTDPRDGAETWVGEQIWRAQRWVDRYLDKAFDLGGGVIVNFGRSDKTQPGFTYAGQVMIGTDGTPRDTGSGAALAGGYSVATVGSVVTCTLDLQCWSLKVNGTIGFEQNLVIAGKWWVIDPNADDSPNLAAFNQTWDSTIGGSTLYEFHDCTVACANCYAFGGNVNGAGRFDNCRRLTTSTPMIDGGFFKAFSHDGFLYGHYTDAYFRHCTWKPHSFVAAYTDPIHVGGLLLWNRVKGTSVASGGNLPAWESGRTYSQYDVVLPRSPDFDPVLPYASGTKVAYGSWNWIAAKALAAGVTPPPTDVSDSNWTLDTSGDHYYSVGAANQSGHALPAAGLGGHNAFWQFYGNLHADLHQGYTMFNATTTPSYENCFWYQGQHVSIYLEKAFKVFSGKVIGDKNKAVPSWDAGTAYVGSNPPGFSGKSSLVRGSDGVEWVAIQASGPGASAKDPANNANPAYWSRGSAYNITGRYCISHGNNTGFSNANLNPNNGFLDTVFGRDFSFNPVQANANNDTADGVHIVNKRNHFANTTASNPLVAGSSS